MQHSQTCGTGVRSDRENHRENREMVSCHSGHGARDFYLDNMPCYLGSVFEMVYRGAMGVDTRCGQVNYFYLYRPLLTTEHGYVRENEKTSFSR
ncbi:MAG: hypothetical protein LE169_01660 [Endomicrobium sp.]|nr:hypothetical protein [Endomicrobium sp.]